MESDFIDNISYAMLHSIPVEKLGLSNRVLNVINYREDNPTFGWLMKQVQSGEILRWRNLGLKGYNELRTKCGLPTASCLSEAWNQRL